MFGFEFFLNFDDGIVWFIVYVVIDLMKKDLDFFVECFCCVIS